MESFLSVWRRVNVAFDAEQVDSQCMPSVSTWLWHIGYIRYARAAYQNVVGAIFLEALLQAATFEAKAGFDCERSAVTGNGGERKYELFFSQKVIWRSDQPNRKNDRYISLSMNMTAAQRTTVSRLVAQEQRASQDNMNRHIIIAVLFLMMKKKAPRNLPQQTITDPPSMVELTTQPKGRLRVGETKQLPN